MIKDDTIMDGFFLDLEELAKELKNMQDSD